MTAGGRPSLVPDEAKLEILRLVADNPGLGATAIAAGLNKAGLRTTKGQPFKRYHVRGVLELREKPPQQGTAGSPPAETGGDNAGTAEDSAAIVKLERLGYRQSMRALPTQSLQVSTQTKRETMILEAETAVFLARDKFLEASGTEEVVWFIAYLRAWRVYDQLLTSAERAEEIHTKTIRALFIINTGPVRSPSEAPEGATLPAPGDDPLPALFDQEAKAYMEELGGTWEKFLERLSVGELNEQPTTNEPEPANTTDD